MGHPGSDLTHSVTGADVLKMICRSVPGVIHKASEALARSDLIATVSKVKRNYRLPSESSRTRASDA